MRVSRWILKLVCFLLELAGMLAGLIAAWGLFLFIWGPEMALPDRVEGLEVVPTICFVLPIIPFMLLGFVAAHMALVLPILVKRPDVAGRAYRFHLWLYRNAQRRLEQIEKD